ncbi:hypothetical protein vseg_011907 [Gypsophila vaccaria]
MMMVVLKLDIHDNYKCKRTAMKIVSTIPGIDSISMNTDKLTLTVTGNMDPIQVVKKLRKAFHTEVLSIGPVKQPEKKNDKPDNQAQVIEYIGPYEFYGYPCYPVYSSHYF